MKFIFWISVIINLALIYCQSDGLTVSSSHHPIFQGIRLKCGEICSKVAFHIFTLVNSQICSNQFQKKKSELLMVDLGGPK